MAHEKRLGVPLKCGDEQDALTGWRKLIRFGPGIRKAAKRSYNRRVRRRPVEVEGPEEEACAAPVSPSPAPTASAHTAAEPCSPR